MQLQNITGAEFARWWKEYVRQLAVLLVSEEPDGRLSPAVTNRISQLTAEQLALMRHVWVSSSAAHELFQVQCISTLYGRHGLQTCIAA